VNEVKNTIQSISSRINEAKRKKSVNSNTSFLKMHKLRAGKEKQEYGIFNTTSREQSLFAL
jgi:hypothetical protein